MSPRLKSLASLIVGQSDRGTLPYVALEHLAGGTGALELGIELPSRVGGEPGSSAVEPGDVLFGKLRPYLSKTLLITEPAYASTELMALRPYSNVDSRYLAYLVGSRAVIEWATASSDGTKMPRTNWEKLGEFRVAGLPPTEMQRTIADYLDTETARIDALITKKKRMIEVLDERVDAMVMSWVGRSELAGGSDVEAVPLRRALKKLERWAVDSGEMITAFRNGEVMTRAARGRDGFTDVWTDDARFQVVEMGDVVVHGLDGFSGAIGDSQSDGVCSPIYHVCRPTDGGDPAFYGRMLRLLATAGYLGGFATSTRERAVDFRNWDLFGRIPIPRVPVDEQVRIGDLVRLARPLKVKVRASEVLAMERRQALITAAVTGELEIPGVAA